MTSNQSLEQALSKILTKDQANIIENELKSLIQSNFNSKTSLQFIVEELAKDTRKLILINTFIQSFTIENPPFNYLSIILSILQSNISQSSLSDIIKLFAEITQRIVLNEVSYSNIEYIDMLVNFCVFNMTEKEIIKQKVGTLCLGQLIYLTPLTASLNKNIWKSIIEFMDTKTFTANNELLTILDIFIEKIKEQFSPYATVTLYKALDFLIGNDWIRRKLTLKVIYDLVYFCSEDIMKLKQQIIDFLDVVRNDQVEEVASMCNSILDLINHPNENKGLRSLEDIIKEGKLATFGKESLLLNEVFISEDNQTGRSNDGNSINIATQKRVMTSPLKVSDLKEENEEENRPLQIKTQLENNKNDPIKKENDKKRKKQEVTINANAQIPERQKRFVKKHQQEKEFILVSNNYNNTGNTKTNENQSKEIMQVQLDEKSKSYYESKITELLKQMKEMSDKQIYLLDVISSLQKTSQEQVNTLNTRILSLESVLSNIIDTNINTNSKLFHKSKNARSHNEILPNIISSAPDKEFMEYIVSLSQIELDNIHPYIIEDAVVRFTIILSKGKYIQQIISVLKYVLIKTTNKFRRITYKNLNDMLVFLSKSKNILVNDEDFIDISLMNSFLNKQTNN